MTRRDLARLLDVLKTFDVEAEDAVPECSGEEKVLSVVFAVSSAGADRIVLELGRGGWVAERVDHGSGPQKREGGRGASSKGSERRRAAV
ncbi:hypothetical protein [Streptomyces arboris]|uniref:Uncharacterized protein n=1 Tax=Streptomyces arboris TaxID=2600619 RepID=A0A5N5EHA4_9ACTN|nr:hypothetical protein [Streptomyces arboris]KAB2589987.1 hypothetical protein F5983_24085 [Streptomyces arboris]